MSVYSFRMTWEFAAPIDRVWDLINHPEEWPRVWKNCRNVEKLRDADANGIGGVQRFSMQTQLPYTLRFEVTATRSGNKAVISVRDRGPGIPEEFLEAVFEPFRRVETSRSRETGGTGIGLTIARAIAERHGGTLTLRNHPEGGLEAVLQLPIGR